MKTIMYIEGYGDITNIINQMATDIDSISIIFYPNGSNFKKEFEHLEKNPQRRISNGSLILIDGYLFEFDDNNDLTYEQLLIECSRLGINPIISQNNYSKDSQSKRMTITPLNET